MQDITTFFNDIVTANYEADLSSLPINRGPGKKSIEDSVKGFELTPLVYNSSQNAYEKYVSLFLTTFQAAGFIIIQDREKDFMTLHSFFTGGTPSEYKIKWMNQTDSAGNLTWLQLYFIMFHLGKRGIIVVKERPFDYRYDSNIPVKKEDDNPVNESIKKLTSFFRCNSSESSDFYAIYDAIRSKRIIKETVGESGKTVKTVQFKVPKAPSTVKSKLTFCLDMMISFKSCHLFKST